MESLRQIISVEVKNELLRRQEKNKRYSLRAYAKQLQVEPSLLSKIIREKVTPTTRTLEKLISSLNIDSERKANLLVTYAENKKFSSLKYKQGKNEFLKIDSNDDWPFSTWDDLVVFSTLGLAESFSINELAKRLEFDIVTMKKILDRLKASGLIEQDGIHYFLKIKQVADGIPLVSCTVKKNIQKKFLVEAYKKIDEVEIDKRLNGTLTFTVDPKVLPKIKQKIARFMTEINGLCHAESNKVSEVYNLTLALYPLRKE